MKPRDPQFPIDGEPTQAEALFSAELRAELRRELGPSAAARMRVRNAVLSSVATGALSPAAQRVDTLLHAQATSAAGAKIAAATSVHSLTAKLVVASVLIGGSATAVVMRGPSSHERPALSAPVAPHVTPAAPRAAAAAAPASEAEATAQQEAASVESLAAAPTQTVEPTAPRGAARTQAVEADTPAPRVRVGRASAARTRAIASAAETPAQAERPLLTDASSAQAKPALQQPTAQLTRLQPGAASAEPVVAERLPEPPDGSSLQPTAASNGALLEPKSTANAAPTTPSAAAAAREPLPTQANAPKHALAAEIALVRAASAALQRNDPQAALTELQRHAAEFPQGALRVEVEALRAIALCTGHAAQAAAVSGKFWQAHAGSPLAERVRRACLEP